MPSQAIETEAAFKEATSADKLTIVKFFATWCGPCRGIAPYYEKFANAEENANVGFYAIDVDELESLAEAQGAETIPFFKFFKGGKEVDSIQTSQHEKLKDKIDAVKQANQ